MQIIEGIHWKTSQFLERQKVVIRKGNKRWVSYDGTRYYEWDSLHGEIEVYDCRGIAIGILNPEGIPSNKKVENGRYIDV